MLTILVFIILIISIIFMSPSLIQAEPITTAIMITAITTFGYGAGMVIGYGVIGILTIGALTGLSLLSSALTRKPKIGGIGESLRQQTITVRDPMASRNIIFGRVRVGGVITFIGSTENSVYFHEVIAFAGHRCQGIKEVYFDDDLAFDADGNIQSKYVKDGVNLARVKKYLGESDQAADSDLIAEFPDKWTINHRGRSICYLYVRLKFNSEVYNNNPNVTAILEGWDEIYDLRGTPSYKWTDNPALCIAAYLHDALGAEYGTEIDSATLIASANICDELVNIPGGTEKRYTLNGVIDTAMDPRSNIEMMLSAMAGRLIYSGGKWYILAGAYETPSAEATFDESDLRSNIEIRPRIPKRDLFNAVKGVFVSPKNKWQPSDFPPFVSDVFMAQDNGERIWSDIELPFTINETMSQRLAKIFLFSTREQISLLTSFSLKALKVKAGETIKLSIARMGWNEKVFLVTDWKFTSSENEENPELLIRIELRETSQAVYDINADEYDLIASAPDTNLPDPSYVALPGNVSIIEELYATRDGAGVKTSAIVTWNASSSAWVREYQVEYKKTADESYLVAGNTPNLIFTIFDIDLGVYSFRVKAITRFAESQYAYWYNFEIFGLLAKPSQVMGLTISTIAGLAILRWNYHPDIDVRIGGSIVFRHSKHQSGALWNESVSIGENVPGSDTVAVLPLKPGSYLVKAKDSSGLLSEEPAIVSTNAATVLAFADIDTINEHPAFPGTHEQTIVDQGMLKIKETPAPPYKILLETGGGLLLESGGYLLGEGQCIPEYYFGVYTFAAGFDFASPRRVKLETELDIYIADEFELFDSRLTNIDEWLSFDGDVDGQGDCKIWARTTDDNPADSPQWSDWQRLDSGEFYSRAIQMQARLSVLDPCFNIYVSQLTVRAKEVV